MDTFQLINKRKRVVILTRKEIQEIIDSKEYWDMQVDELKIDSFCNNISIGFFNNNKIYYNFLNCYKFNFEHCLQYTKEQTSDENILPPCFFRDVSVEEFKEEITLHLVKVDIYPIKLEILCEKVEIIEAD